MALRFLASDPIFFPLHYSCFWGWSSTLHPFYQALPIHLGCHLPWIHQVFMLTFCSARPRNHCCSSIIFNNPDKEAKFIPLEWCRKVIHTEIKRERSLWLEATTNLWEQLPTYLRCCLGNFHWNIISQSLITLLVSGILLSTLPPHILPSFLAQSPPNPVK